MISKIAIGTAQFGLDYGINNPKGQIKFEEVKKILQRCSEAGIELLDTAVAYGNSEKVIGNAQADLGHQFKIVSKLPHKNDVSIAGIVDKCISNLGVQRLYGFLIHSYDDFVRDPGLLRQINHLKQAGKVKKTGFSLYDPVEAQMLLDKGVEFDLVQIPYSVFDQRFESVMHALHENGVEIHTRSVFLQGLPFIPESDLPSFYEPIREKLDKLRTLMAAHNIPLECGLLNFALLNDHIDNTVIGVDSLENLENNLDCVNYLDDVRLIIEELRSFNEENPDMILPTRWPKT